MWFVGHVLFQQPNERLYHAIFDATSSHLPPWHNLGGVGGFILGIVCLDDMFPHCSSVYRFQIAAVARQQILYDCQRDYWPGRGEELLLLHNRISVG